jgi:hypothetical protein
VSTTLQVTRQNPEDISRDKDLLAAEAVSRERVCGARTGLFLNLQGSVGASGSDSLDSSGAYWLFPWAANRASFDAEQALLRRNHKGIAQVDNRHLPERTHGRQ